jgi:hypothetical protein
MNDAKVFAVVFFPAGSAGASPVRPQVSRVCPRTFNKRAHVAGEPFPVCEMPSRNPEALPPGADASLLACREISPAADGFSRSWDNLPPRRPAPDFPGVRTVPPDDSQGSRNHSTDSSGRSTVPCSRSTDSYNHSTVPWNHSTVPWNRSTDSSNDLTVPYNHSTDFLNHSTVPWNRSTNP